VEACNWGGQQLQVVGPNWWDRWGLDLSKVASLYVVLCFCLRVWVSSGEADDDSSVGSTQSAHVHEKSADEGLQDVVIRGRLLP